MAFIAANSGRTAYGIKHLIFDTVEELAEVNTTDLYPGTTAFIIDTSDNYMLNSKLEWKKVNLSIGSGGGSDDGPSAGGDVIYEGGVEV